jgi:exodeoxyribonuclease VII large subunit
MLSRLTLLELNNLIGDTIKEHLADSFWVVAEISEMKVNRSGHCYLELVEKNAATDEIAARMRAIIWSYTFRMLKPYFETSTGQPFSEGIKVLIQTSVEFHPSYGLSLNIRDIDPAYTVGDLVRRRREIIAGLQQAGVFDMNRELPLPLVPQRIAVISSATAAGYQDFIHQLTNNPYGFLFHHSLFEAFMQGTEAVPSMLKALDEIFSREEHFDAVAIIRGGGAQADLSCFDNFELAFAVAQFPIPVITGIGHEKDDTILDLVAHTRQKTPTAVAEFFISGMISFRDRLEKLRQQAADQVTDILDLKDQQLEEFAVRTRNGSSKYLNREQIQLIRTGHRNKSSVNQFVLHHFWLLERYQLKISGMPPRLIGNKLNHCLRLVHAFRIVSRSALQSFRADLSQANKRFPPRVRARLFEASRELGKKEETLRLLDPSNIMKRGFTITRQDGRVLKSASAVSRETDLETLFHDGSVFSKIIKDKAARIEGFNSVENNLHVKPKIVP